MEKCTLCMDITCLEALSAAMEFVLELFEMVRFMELQFLRSARDGAAPVMAAARVRSGSI